MSGIGRDRGRGVAPEKLAQLTTPVFRGDTARTAATGAGLGLAIVQAIVQRCSCSLKFDSQADGLRVDLGMPLRR